MNKYLTRKVGEIAKAGANVVFERGLWSSKDRKELREYYKNNGVDCEIHYVCVDDDTWKQNIAERNQRVLDGNGGSDFYLDEGLMKKLESKWEEPTVQELEHTLVHLNTHQMKWSIRFGSYQADKRRKCFS